MSDSDVEATSVLPSFVVMTFGTNRSVCTVFSTVSAARLKIAAGMTPASISAANTSANTFLRLLLTCLFLLTF